MELAGRWFNQISEGYLSQPNPSGIVEDETVEDETIVSDTDRCYKPHGITFATKDARFHCSNSLNQASASNSVRMSQQLKMLNLNCPNCGGLLEIQSDMDRFACGYCGSEQIVERRGGTVALRLVVDAVARVQVGTDRTAAELALVRLEKEIASVRAQWQVASANLVQSRAASSQLESFGVISAIGLVVLCGFILLIALMVGSENVSVVSIVFALAGGAAFIFLRRHITAANKQYTATRSELWAPYAQRIGELEELFKKNREMVDRS